MIWICTHPVGKVKNLYLYISIYLVSIYIFTQQGSPFADISAPYLAVLSTIYNVIYLTIISWAQVGSESVAPEAEGRRGYWLRGHEARGKRS